MVALLLSLALWVAPVPADQDSKKKTEKQKEYENSFLVFGTVFQEPGFLLRGAQIEVRRSGEQKVRWRAVSDARGEFAVRVPREAEYELTVKAKGFQTHEQKVDARKSSREDLVIRLKPSPEEKKP